MHCGLQAGVQHTVFSSLEDVRHFVPKGDIPEVAPGRIVPFFESKEEIEVGFGFESGQRKWPVLNLSSFLVVPPHSGQPLDGRISHN